MTSIPCRQVRSLRIVGERDLVTGEVRPFRARLIDLSIRCIVEVIHEEDPIPYFVPDGMTP